MKKLLCGLLCLLLLGCASAEGYLYAAKGDNGLWGHIDEAGNWVIPPKFDDASDFRGNYAWIQQGDREGFAKLCCCWMRTYMWTVGMMASITADAKRAFG